MPSAEEIQAARFALMVRKNIRPWCIEWQFKAYIEEQMLAAVRLQQMLFQPKEPANDH